MEYFVHPTAIIEEGARIGTGCKIWHHCHIRSTAIIGDGTSLGKNVYVDARVKIGARCKIQNNVSLYQGVDLADDVFIGPNVVFTNDLYPRAFEDWNESKILPTKIHKGVSIGANASILCGIEIGEYSMIGMGCVLLHDTKAYQLWVGNPGKLKGMVSRTGQIIQKF
jgi:UDP-2-acetamido-3-amino-2,3-dideoxy-glucuronate N-acetyltransferase